MAQPFLRIAALQKRYGKETALDAVTLDVRRGELVTVLGPSGSGKTSLLMIVAGFVDPDGGDVLLQGCSLLDKPPNRRNLGVVFQQYALFPHLNVRDNIAYPLVARRMPATSRAERVENALGLIRLQGLERRYPRELSGGQQQRVALARAVVFEPPILLMDEPLSALDRKLRGEMQLEIRALQKKLEITTIYVTHDQEEALTISDRIVILRQGKLVQADTPMEIYERPADAFVASFMGDANLLSATVIGIDSNEVLVRVTAGAVVRVARDGAYRVGDSVVLVVRPERVRLGAVGGPARVAARVEDAVYLGSSWRLVLRAGDQRLLAVWREILPDRAPTVGQEVAIDLEGSRPVLVRDSGT